jgi:hypothetical protein
MNLQRKIPSEWFEGYARQGEESPKKRSASIEVMDSMLTCNLCGASISVRDAPNREQALQRFIQDHYHRA